MYRKYKEVEGWYVYLHKTPDNYYYVGISKRPRWLRWNPAFYKRSPLFYKKILEFGWNNIEHFYLVDGLTYEQAEKIEDQLIKMYKSLGISLNKKNSGGWRKDKNKVSEYNSKYNKLRYSRTEDIIYMRVKDFNRYHPDRKIETPLEAKQKYLQRGYVPDYIKID